MGKFIFSSQVLSAYHHHQTLASTPSQSGLCKFKSGPLDISHPSQGKDQTTKLLNVRGQDGLTLFHSTLFRCCAPPPYLPWSRSGPFQSLLLPCSSPGPWHLLVLRPGRCFLPLLTELTLVILYISAPVPLKQALPNLLK